MNFGEWLRSQLRKPQYKPKMPPHYGFTASEQESAMKKAEQKRQRRATRNLALKEAK